jgi:hypothetical protein
MKNKTLLVFLLTLLAGSLYSQTICDSVYVTPAAVYINQSADTSVFVEVTYTGEGDISYSICRFNFPDSGSIDINEMAVTNGVAGPFTFVPPWGYKVIYNNPAIPSNTVVNAQFNIYHGSGSIDCTMPITFIVNSTTNIAGTETGFKVQLFPNPVHNYLNVQSGTPGFELALYDLSGREVFSQNFQGTMSLIDINGLSAGIYIVVLKNSFISQVQKIVKLKN